MLEKTASTGDSVDRASDRLQLPFILVSAPRDCHVHCEMLEDRTQYFFEFDAPFQINEDLELLRLMGLDTARPEQVKAFFPKELITHVLLLSLSNAGVGFFTPNNNNNLATAVGNNTATSIGGLAGYRDSEMQSEQEEEEEEFIDEDDGEEEDNIMNSSEPIGTNYLHRFTLGHHQQQ